MKGTEEKLAHATFSEIPQQFLEYMKMMNINTKKTKDNKNKWSKKEIRRKLESRKRKNFGKIHPIESYLLPTKLKFIESFIPLGYNPDLVESIIENGISSYSFNLMTQLITIHQKEEKKKEGQPISVISLMQPEELKRFNLSRKQVNILDKNMMEEGTTQIQDEEGSEGFISDMGSDIDSDEAKDFVVELDERERYTKVENPAIRNKILPESKQLFLRDKIPEKKSEEW